MRSELNDCQYNATGFEKRYSTKIYLISIQFEKKRIVFICKNARSFMSKKYLLLFIKRFNLTLQKIKRQNQEENKEKHNTIISQF